MKRFHLYILQISFLVFLVSFSGCSNDCELLAERICDQAVEDKLECKSSDEASAPKSDDVEDKRCKQIRSVIASCSDLQEQARHPTNEDLTACKQNLEFIRSLERQMQ